MGSTATLRHTCDCCDLPPWYEDPPDPDAWRDAAACRGESIDTFFPARGAGLAASIARARATCKVCPVVAECLALALEQPAMADLAGVFGGTTAAERAVLRARPPTHRGPR
jgi:WhiB family redox-sensing transcriptional regulator